MAQTNIDFINTASKHIPVFDGKAENLTSFIDALERRARTISSFHNKNKAKRCRQQ